ncbi:hypothetical protein, partial [Dermacoccus nishinomiyaensis]|uniref:hypothetical protein n=1 Tax=Dermacoccus nishinomiyaensis TaxID=1274 RepID=UPI001C92D5A0
GVEDEVVEGEAGEEVGGGGGMEGERGGVVVEIGVEGEEGGVGWLVGWWEGWKRWWRGRRWGMLGR